RIVRIDQYSSTNPHHKAAVSGNELREGSFIASTNKPIQQNAVRAHDRGRGQVARWQGVPVE
ncbi:MAG TPA: hypothetical protein VMY37_07900, partial [Thermoguttaceae bacterium]|nr:hypothetical protein [Thermoguttaceae bacterium]